MVPHCRPPAWPDIPATRAAACIRRVPEPGCRLALIGLPDDLGVRLNGGRTGASSGPRAFRAALARYGAASSMGGELPPVYDAGDIVPAERADALDETHARVTATVRALLDAGLFPIAIGGGHDLTFPFVRAVIQHHRERGVHLAEGVYADAHLDVRDTPGSGMPFRRLIETCGVERLGVSGLDPLANTREHHEWFVAHGGRVIAGADVELPRGPFFASFDLDVIDAAHAPGVSAMNPAGWTVREAAAWVERVGASAGLVCFDIMELCPPHDLDQRTARAAAHLFLRFLHAFARRGGS